MPVKTSKINRRKWQDLREDNKMMVESIIEEVGVEGVVETMTFYETGTEYLVFDKRLKLEPCGFVRRAGDFNVGLPAEKNWNLFALKPGGYKLSSEWLYIGTLPESALVSMLWYSYYGESLAETAVEIC